MSDDGGTGGPDDGAAELPDEPDAQGFVSVRSFVVRAMLERDGDHPAWHGSVTDVATGTRRLWHRTSEVARFIDERLLRAHTDSAFGREGVAMATPTLTDVVNDMLALLAARLPLPSAGLPDPNVTLDHVDQRLVGLGNHRGSERSALGRRALRGGRLDAGVRFQLWGGSPGAADDAVLALHTDILDDRDQLRADGFLKLEATGTSVAEHIDTLDAWRRTASYDLLYEYQYRDTDGADSLIARIPIDADLDETGSSRETLTVTDEMARWDDETSPDLVVRGPATIHRISALTFFPATPPGGTVTVRRTSDDATGPPTSFGDLASFLGAVGGDDPAQRHAEVALAPLDLLADIGAGGDGIDLGDWDTDGITDSYDPFDRAVDPAVGLADPRDRFEIAYSAAGLDQQAVVYLRINAP